MVCCVFFSMTPFVPIEWTRKLPQRPVDSSFDLLYLFFNFGNNVLQARFDPLVNEFPRIPQHFDHVLILKKGVHLKYRLYEGLSAKNEFGASVISWEQSIWSWINNHFVFHIIRNERVGEIGFSNENNFIALIFHSPIAYVRNFEIL